MENQGNKIQSNMMQGNMQNMMQNNNQQQVQPNQQQVQPNQQQVQQVQPNQQPNQQVQQVQPNQQNQQQTPVNTQPELNEIKIDPTNPVKTAGTRKELCYNNYHLECPSFSTILDTVQRAIKKKRINNVNAVWFQKYRPALIEELIFPNKDIQDLLYSFVKNKRIKGNCLFYGGHGLGKTTLNKILMNACITHSADLYILKKGMSNVDKLVGWVNGDPSGNQKIVVCEEFDQLSQQAQTTLKDGVLERDDDKLVFLATTNYFDQIDGALIGRFLNKIAFETIDREALGKRVEWILKNEKIHYTEETIQGFLTAVQHQVSIRDILSSLEICSFRGVLEPQLLQSFAGSSEDEQTVCNYVMQHLNYYYNTLDANTLSNLCYRLDAVPAVKQIREQILNITKANPMFNWDSVYRYLIQQINFVPIKKLTMEYYNDLKLKNVKHFHFECFLDEVIINMARCKGARI